MSERVVKLAQLTFSIAIAIVISACGVVYLGLTLWDYAYRMYSIAQQVGIRMTLLIGLLGLITSFLGFMVLGIAILVIRRISKVSWLKIPTE